MAKGYATVGTKDGSDEQKGVSLRKTCMTGIRSAGFFTKPQGTTIAGNPSTEGTFRYKENKNGKEEFAARNSIQNRRQSQAPNLQIHLREQQPMPGKN